jgi:PAS domain-containing protein
LAAKTKNIKDYPFLHDAGEAGYLVLKFDWARTSIGDIDHWPVGLQINLGNILHSAFPMFLFWGDDFLCFYNDAFRPSLGADGKHPAIGKKAIVVWGEIWHFIGPLLQKVFVTHKPVWFEDQHVPFYRNGKVEDIYWTFCYSPAFDENNEVQGVLVTCIETTANVLAKKEN